MKILAIVMSYALAVMVGAVVSAALFRNKRRKARKRCAEFVEKRDRAADAKRGMEQAVLHIKYNTPDKKQGVTVFHSSECAEACGGKFVPKGDDPL